MLGVVQANGRVGYFSPAIRIDEAFVERANRGRAPERRFRFADHCVQGQCAHWKDDTCGLIQKVMHAGEANSRASLPTCSIRPSCRWFSQEGSRACSVCPLVVTQRDEMGDRTA